MTIVHVSILKYLEISTLKKHSEPALLMFLSTPLSFPPFSALLGPLEPSPHKKTHLGFAAAEL